MISLRHPDYAKKREKFQYQCNVISQLFALTDGGLKEELKSDIKCYQKSHITIDSGLFCLKRLEKDSLKYIFQRNMSNLSVVYDLQILL